MAGPKGFKDLQIAQREHDQAFHRDVFYRSSPARLRHYCLHYGKYVGRVARETAEGEELNKSLQSTLTDAMVISLALSDVLNVSLDNELEAAFGKPARAGLAGWASTIDTSKKKMALSQVRMYFLERGAVATGDLCKVAESLDHIEGLEPKSRLIEGLVAWLALILVCASNLGLDLEQSIEARWKEVEHKRIT